MILIRQLVNDFLGLLFPYLCNGCGTQLYHGEKEICTKCRYDLPFTDFQNYAANPVAKLFWGRIPCNGAMAMLYFRKGSKVQHLIHRLKYKDQTQTGIELGKLLGERLLSSPTYQTTSLIIPVPLHPKKQKSRGYNQSEYIARGIAEIMQVPVSTTHLIRQHHTSTQTKKGRYDRFENMQSVFTILNPGQLENQHILLVDDVITTGSTLEASGITLLATPIKQLSIAALAYSE